MGSVRHQTVQVSTDTYNKDVSNYILQFGQKIQGEKWRI